jgi:hypothetical protein
VRREVLVAVTLENTVAWDIAPCSVAVAGLYCLDLQAAGAN